MRTEDGASKVVLVKFVVKYNAGAHQLLADHSPPLAPALHVIIPVIGDMTMVVMDYVSAKPLHDSLPLQSSAPKQSAGTFPRLSSYFKDMAWFFEISGNQNVLYSPEDVGRALLVDFDGVGRHGKNRYSACLTPDAGLGVTRL